MRPPTVGPRLVLAAGAGAAALLLPLWSAAVLLVSAIAALLFVGDRATIRSGLAVVVALSVGTLLLTPVWLHLLAGIPLDLALRVAGALTLRLDTVLLIGLTLSAALPPIAWLAATRRYPRLGLVLTLTFRQIPELAAETERVRRAQRARGLLLGPWTRRPIGIAVPIVVRSMERAGRMGEALTLAGWSSGRPETTVVRPAWRWRDVLWSGLGLALLAVALLALINPS